MCVLAELGMTIFGIVTLVKGQIRVSGKNTVRGVPAYLIGGLLTSTIPIMFALGFAFGLFVGITGRDMDAPEMRTIFAGLEVAGVLSILLTCLFASWMFGSEPMGQGAQATSYSTAHPFQDPDFNKPPPQSFDPRNPYAPPVPNPLDNNR
jgi:hypothetical protein